MMDIPIAIYIFIISLIGLILLSALLLGVLAAKRGNYTLRIKTNQNNDLNVL
ncbi:MAG TPA: hypothetical protein VIM70_03970 [Clostridium sp.]|uniref:hypothetical protein n=1 Tax=Clostridium sp. TaxID=1506 RepID=UPI002F955034